MINGKFNTPPNLSEAIQYAMDDNSARIRVALPGKIKTYNPIKRTAEIILGYNRVYNDGTVKKIDSPLVDVPVFTNQGGGIHVSFPIIPGDECLVVFADINIDAWHAFGGQQTPLDQRRHDISDGFAIVGPNSLANPVLSFLLPIEGGLAGPISKVAINQLTGQITISNLTGQSLLISLTAIITSMKAVNTGIIADAATIPAAAAAATTANTALDVVLVQLALLLY